MKAISVKGLNKTYFYHEKEPGLKGAVKNLFGRKTLEKQAIKDFDFELEEGEILGLIGPNGAGKTTIMKLLSGIIQPTSGEMSVLGYNPSKLESEYKMQYALIMGQKSQLWWDLPAYDTFLLNKEIYGVSDEDFNKKLALFSEMFDLGKLLNVQVRKLSLGERMKMELISCLLHNPKVIFLDEPTIGLDAISQKNVRKFLREINAVLGVTIILTSHYMEDIRYLCKRVVVINNSEKVYDGDLDKLINKYNQYKTITVSFNDVYDEKIDLDVEWIEKGKYKNVFKVEKDRIGVVLEQLVKKYEIEDIRIEEKEIGSLVERIYNEGGKINEEVR